jgi:hypothetical protein
VPVLVTITLEEGQRIFSAQSMVTNLPQQIQVHGSYDENDHDKFFSGQFHTTMPADQGSFELRRATQSFTGPPEQADYKSCNIL